MTSIDRATWMDLLRGVAVLMVVVLHVSDFGGYDLEWFAAGNSFFQPLRMPLLMFLSGMLLQRSLMKPWPQYLWGKIAAIGWPLLLWLCIYGFLIRGGVGFPENAVEFFVSADYLWFLSTLLACYLIGLALIPVLRSGRGKQLALISGMGGLVFLASSTVDPFNTDILWFGGFFFLGAGLHAVLPRLQKMSWKWMLPVAVLVVIGAAGSLTIDVLTSGNIPGIALSISAILLSCWIAIRIRAGAISNFFTWAGRGSIVIYVVHFPLITLLRDFGFVHTNLLPEAEVILLSLSAIALSLVALALRPWTRWLYVSPHPRSWTKGLRNLTERRGPTPRFDSHFSRSSS